MIYLKPIGGLCNRLRAIDSCISLCKIHGQDLTVLWVLDASLNCSFFSLFEMPQIPGVQIEVIDCPSGFPELYMKQFGLLENKSYKHISEENQFVRNAKNLLKGRFLDDKQKKVRTSIMQLPAKNVLTNDEMAIVHDSINTEFTKSNRELDALFIVEIEPVIKSLFNEETSNSYISSCYRLHPIEGQYEWLVPQDILSKKISNLTNRFDTTYGIHIRATDHVVSKNHSSASKFSKLIDELLVKDNAQTFLLSTDDTDAKAALQSKYKEKIFFNEIENYDRNSPEAIKDALVDLYCLAQTSKIFGSHQSTFSQTAADIGGIQEFTVK